MVNSNMYIRIYIYVYMCGLFVFVMFYIHQNWNVYILYAEQTRKPVRESLPSFP